jgi:hypothetical protein
MLNRATNAFTIEYLELTKPGFRNLKVRIMVIMAIGHRLFVHKFLLL